jgi:coproporphyrinogen III oxidase-like Fe-S oxidoreductase
MKATSCPFCGIATEVPHETQEGCIEALHREIRRVRELLAQSRPLGQPALPADEPEEKEERT